MISRHNYIGQVDIKILQVMAKLRHNTHETYRTVCMSLQQIQFKCKFKICIFLMVGTESQDNSRYINTSLHGLCEYTQAHHKLIHPISV